MTLGSGLPRFTLELVTSTTMPADDGRIPLEMIRALVNERTAAPDRVYDE